MEIMKRILLCLLLFFAGCVQSTTKLGPNSIGRDPTWFPLRLGRKAINVTGFSNALVQEIANIENKNFQIVDISWIQLFEGLEKGEYAGVLTSLEPNAITEESYSFSDSFLYLGPVLVVPESANVDSLSDLEGLIVGAYAYDDSVLILQRYPSILIETYQNLTNGLQGILDGSMAGALVPNLEARAIIPNLYTNELKIVTEPLSNKGLRLATLKNQNMELIKSFNNGLEKLRKDGTYMELRTKFSIK
jgi:ABC-type amino acid transport substrate-binding protein